VGVGPVALCGGAQLADAAFLHQHPRHVAEHHAVKIVVVDGVTLARENMRGGIHGYA